MALKCKRWAWNCVKRVQKETKDQDNKVIGNQAMILPRRKSSCYSKDKIDEIKDNLTQQLEGQKSETRKERSRLIEKYDFQINNAKISLNELNSDLELTKQQTSNFKVMMDDVVREKAKVIDDSHRMEKS